MHPIRFLDQSLLHDYIITMTIHSWRKCHEWAYLCGYYLSNSLHSMEIFLGETLHQLGVNDFHCAIAFDQRH